MRPCARAAIGVVSELMDVHSALGIGVVAGDVIADGRRRRLVGLFEGDGAFDVGVTSEHGNCVDRGLA